MDNKKRVQLMLNVQNDTIINNIIGGFKTMMNKILKPSNVIKGYKIINRVKWVIATILNKLENVLKWVGYNWVGYKVDIIVIEKEIKALNELFENFAKNNKPTTNKLQKEINALKSANEAQIIHLKDSIVTLSQAHSEDINILIKNRDELKEINKLASKRHKRLLEKVNDLDKALQLATAMTKTEHDNLKNSFNEYVLRPKAEKMIKDYDKEDYSYEYELEQKNEALIEALRQQGISDNVINNIIDTLLLKLNLNDEGDK